MYSCVQEKNWAFDKKICAKLVADTACFCLSKELALYPKPGLVSLVDSGSHKDMDASHFEASIASLHPFFSKIFIAGQEGRPFSDLKELGIQAEALMMEATDRINTHRGAIFSLGLIAAALGCLNMLNRQISARSLTKTVSEKWSNHILAAFIVPQKSNGLDAYEKYGIGGARTEAAYGFKSIMEHGLPALHHALYKGKSLDTALMQAFFALLAVTNDTTLVHRAGVEGLDFARNQAEIFLVRGGVDNPCWQQVALEMHHEFIKRNMSPGGVADLLSATLFCWKLEKMTWEN